MHTPNYSSESREEYLARAAQYIDAHVRTTNGRCGTVVATAQRRHKVISLVVRYCDEVKEQARNNGVHLGNVFRTDNEHSTISEQHAL